jgi:radical SAM superfamily enzyme YgiQ (UPF0313 family)
MTEKITFLKLYHPWQYDPYSDPPLGLLSVAAQARKSGLEVRLFDQAFQKDIPESDYYGLSATTLEYPEALKQAGRIKEAYPKAKIIAGGVHFDVFPETDWLKEIDALPFDVICRGEGEGTIGRAVGCLNSGLKKQVISRTDLLDLDSLELPARDLLDRARYFIPGETITGMNTGGNSSTIMVSRGCPMKCAFCASPTLHHRRVRFRSIDNTIKELEELRQKYNVNALRFQDDNIPLNLKKHPALAPFLANLGIYSRGSARVDSVTPEMLDLLWQAGFRELGFGVESASQKVLDYISKGTTIEQNRYALKLTKERGFKTRAFIMTGLAGEDRDSADKMIEFLSDTKPDVVTLTSFIPLPGSDIYMHPEKYGVRIKTKDWARYDIAIKWDKGTEWAHELVNLSQEEMESNREKLKSYIFNTGISNVSVYNKPYGKKD